MTLDGALHVNDAICYLNYCKSPLRYCLNTEALMMLHIGGCNISGKAQTSPSILIFKNQASFAQTSKKHIVRTGGVRELPGIAVGIWEPGLLPDTVFSTPTVFKALIH